MSQIHPTVDLIQRIVPDAKVEIIDSEEVLKRFNHDRDVRPVTKPRDFVLLSDQHGNSVVYNIEDLDIPDDVVWLVMKNADFTEGRGPMSPHRLYLMWSHAVAYVLAQDGIYGSRQGIETYAGVSVNGNAYCVSGFNGYDIKPMQLRSCI